MAQTKQSANREDRRRNDRSGENTDRTDLRNSPTMARLMDALEQGTDIGHYGQFTFVTVARHFLDEDQMIDC